MRKSTYTVNEDTDWIATWISYPVCQPLLDTARPTQLTRRIIRLNNPTTYLLYIVSELLATIIPSNLNKK